MISARFEVLGKNVLRVGAKAFSPERKTAAVVAYLALEGPTRRSRLAGLLWPDSEEGTARNNLSQLLRRLKRLSGGELVHPGDALSIAEGLEVDAAQLRAAALSGRAEAAARLSGELLGAHDYDDLPEFGEWLWSAREELDALRKDALESLVTSLEAQGDLRGALAYAERLVEAEPVSEAAHRYVMRFHYLLGDRPAAFKAYARLKEILRREVGVAPLPETAELARRIEREALPRPAPPATKVLPPQVLRPPVLVGREREWEELEAAWARGQTIYITGEPGVGKTRLAQEFVASKGRCLYLGAQPGVQDVLFAAAAGLARTRIAGAPEVALPEWVERELARILPEYRTADPPPPLRSEDDKLRFYQAYLEMARLKGAGYAATVSDDTQYYDAATVELGGFMIAHSAAQAAPGVGAPLPRYVIVYRRGELPPASQERIDQFVRSGVAARIDLEPLGPEDTAALLGSLGLGGGATPELAEAVFRRTGGNALFILELVRDLLETDRLQAAALERQPLSRRVRAVVEERLSRVSPAAQRAVQAAAVLQRDFDPELVARVLGGDPLALLGDWEALERAHIFRGGGFSHDLLYEAVAASLSPQVAALLHRRAAEVLAERGATPVRVANHYLSSGDEARAAPYLLEAAGRAKDALRLAEAAERFEEAGRLLERHGGGAAAFDAYRQALELRLEADLGDAELERRLHTLRRAAKTPLMAAMVWRLAAQRGLRRGDYPGAEAAARAGLGELELRDDPRARTDLLAALALALARQNRLGAASEVAATLQETAQTLPEADPDAKWPSVQLSGVAAVLDELGLRTDALALYRRALALPSGSRDRLVQLAEYGYSLLTYGDGGRALATLEDASEQLAGVDDAAVIKTRVLTSLGATYHHLGRYAEALAVYETSLAISDRYGHAVQSEGTRVRRARLHLSLGALGEAEADVRAAQASASPRHLHQVYIEALCARLAARRGASVAEFFGRIEARLEGADERLRVFVRLEQILALPPTTPELRSALAEEIYTLSRPFDLPTVDLAAHTLYAQRLLALGQAEAARLHTEGALELLGRYTSVYLYPLEVLLTHYRVLAALGDPQAGPVLVRAAARLKDLLAHVPEAYREPFLSHNLINREVLREAQRLGLPPVAAPRKVAPHPLTTQERALGS